MPPSRKKRVVRKKEPRVEHPRFLFAVTVFAVLIIAAAAYDFRSVHFDRAIADAKENVSHAIQKVLAPSPPKLDTDEYDKRMLALSHIDIASTTLSKAPLVVASSTASTTPPVRLAAVRTASTSVSIAGREWPAPAPYPKVGALLPFHRIVAYYGNFYSTAMGVLGEYPEETLLKKLEGEVQAWEAADPNTPVIPAIHYIVETAQGNPGKDGRYRLRMPDDQIDKALALAENVHGLVFLDFQVGLSNVETELPVYEEYLKKPNVHLALDPEFSMKTGAKPGTVIGTMDAHDINYAADYLAKLVRENNLPPKVLVIHRFTYKMVTNYQNIRPLPEVQVVMDMDGWGFGAKKLTTYNTVINPEPVQFTGFKLFYKNDLKPPSTRLLTPAEVLSLTPSPIYIQYQ